MDGMRVGGPMQLIIDHGGDDREDCGHKDDDNNDDDTGDDDDDRHDPDDDDHRGVWRAEPHWAIAKAMIRERRRRYSVLSARRATCD